jgi:DNA-binding PadR family transcriptional regulator
MRQVDPAQFLPLTQTTYYVLASLADGPKHGYLISRDVEARTDGTVRLGVGNTYTTLQRLMDDGLVERLEAVPSSHQGRLRKTYRLTGLGERVLDQECVRLRRMLAASPPRARLASTPV